MKFTIAKLCEGENADGPSDTYSQHKQTELTERSEDRLVIERSAVVSITDLCISYEETGVAELEQGLRDTGLTPAPSTTPSGTEPQTTRGDMMDNRLKQQQVQEDSLVAVLVIEDSDRKEQWLNCMPEDHL